MRCTAKVRSLLAAVPAVPAVGRGRGRPGRPRAPLRATPPRSPCAQDGAGRCGTRPDEAPTMETRPAVGPAGARHCQSGARQAQLCWLRNNDLTIWPRCCRVAGSRGRARLGRLGSAGSARLGRLGGSRIVAQALICWLSTTALLLYSTLPRGRGDDAATRPAPACFFHDPPPLPTRLAVSFFPMVKKETIDALRPCLCVLC